jgi:Ion channel
MNSMTAPGAESPSPETSNWLWQSLGVARRNQPGRYTVLLASILVMLIAQPIFVRHTLAQGLTLVTMSLVLLSALFTLNVSRTYFVLGIILALPALVSRGILQFERNQTAEVIIAVTASAFIMVTVVGLVRQLFKVKRVTFDTISAAICAYLLLALAWAFMFALIELESPGSFSSGLFVKHAASGSALLMTMNNAIYYSFVCLTTTGYGDIAPLSEFARTLSILESVTGQMYLAILIARLVSLEVAQSMMSDR